MFLKKTPNKSGRINLAIVDGYYDKATKKTKHKVIESLGYLDELEKQYDDPIDYFTKRAKKLTEEKKASCTLSQCTAFHSSFLLTTLVWSGSFEVGWVKSSE